MIASSADRRFQDYRQRQPPERVVAVDQTAQRAGRRGRAEADVKLLGCRTEVGQDRKETELFSRTRLKRC